MSDNSSPSSSSSSPPSLSVLQSVTDDVWSITTPFRFFGLISINNNGLIIRVPLKKQQQEAEKNQDEKEKEKEIEKENNEKENKEEEGGGSVLIAINAPSLSSALINDIHALENYYNSPLKYIIVTDWHHLYTPQYIKEWEKEGKKKEKEGGGIEIIFPSNRGPNRHLSDPLYHYKILDRINPQLELIDTNYFQLIPYLGFNGIMTKKEENPRGEYSIYLPDKKLLFLFDIIITQLQGWIWKTEKPIYKRNNKGFIIYDKIAAKESAKRLKELSINILCTSHGDINFGAITKDNEEIQRAMNTLNDLVNLE